MTIPETLPERLHLRTEQIFRLSRWNRTAKTIEYVRADDTRPAPASLEAAYRAGHSRGRSGGNQFSENADWEQDRADVLSALQPAPAADGLANRTPLGIRPITWEPTERPVGCWSGELPFKTYYEIEASDTGFHASRGVFLSQDREDFPVEKTMEAAQATCEADWRKRVSAALESVPSAEDQSAIIERMAQAIRDQNRTHIKQSHPGVEFHRECLTDHDLALARVALEAARAATSKVNPLEWYEISDPKGFQSQGPLHLMTIYENDLGSWTLDDGEAVSPHATLEAAQEAGRVALEQRIFTVCGGTA